MMLRVYSCITQEHDVRLVVVAGLICFLAALTAFLVLQQAESRQERRPLWIGLAAFVSGTGIWSTHFIAMLAYRPNLPVGYDVSLTLLSIVAAILITGCGWAISLNHRRSAALAGGALIAVGIGTMHYTGMAAMNLAGRVMWDGSYVTLSLLLGLGFTVAAVADRRARPQCSPWRPALLLTLGICSLHFIAMAAASIVPDSRLEVPSETIGSATLTIVVIVMALAIFAISFAVVCLDRKLARSEAEQAHRLKAFADAAVEGLVVVDNGRIVDANKSFLSLAGYDSLAAAPDSLSEVFPGLALSDLRMSEDAAAIECILLSACEERCDVEVLLRPLDWRNCRLHVLAVRDISERKAAAARIEHLAYHDAMTGLPNRAVFSEHLSRTIGKASAEEESVAVLAIDLDGFKAVNDIYGHPLGDELLVAVTHRLRSVVRGNEMVARVGGDEFMVAQAGGIQPHHAGLLSERILKVLSEPFTIGADTVRIGGSIGVALYPSDAANQSDLIKNADMALYRAKRDGRGITRFYEASMDEALRQRRQLEADLRHAIARGELALHYQPLADLETGRVIGLEALARWNHPRLGPISPEQFIRLAEESGLIIKLGEWVLREACSEAARWTPPLKLSVNLSPVQFMQHDLAGSIEQILHETGFDPRRLDLEITEGLLIKDTQHAVTVLERLQVIGVEISMDDFGTGYSSLSYFRLFRFDKLKIDQSFVRDMIDNPQARAIIRSVIGLGRGLGMPVVAEGVETAEQLEALRAEGCDQVQGYFISRPNPICYFEGVVLDRSATPEDETLSQEGQREPESALAATQVLRAHRVGGSGWPQVARAAASL
jgi:diguanylate cyclase (GGDEF)-like protein/PAS domain S-box-containing protein